MNDNTTEKAARDYWRAVLEAAAQKWCDQHDDPLVRCLSFGRTHVIPNASQDSS